MRLSERTAISFSAAAGLSLLAGLAGLILFALIPFAAARLAVSPTVLNYTLHPLLWNLATLLLLLWATRGKAISTLRPFALTAPGWVKRSVMGAPIMIAAAALSFSPLTMLSIDALWRSAPGPSWALGQPASYRGEFPIALTMELVLFQLFLRIPLTVLVEEAFFRGFLQPRLGRFGPAWSALLFAVYHLPQWWTIPSLIPTGLVLGGARWWFGTIWLAAALHYAGNAIYLLSALG